MSTQTWMITGPPGAGKTTAAAMLLAHLPQPAALLDKDTMFGSLLDVALTLSGQEPGDRLCSLYTERLRDIEYAALLDTAREILAGGCGVVLSSPFTADIRDTQRWEQLIRRLGTTPTVLWVHAQPGDLKARQIARGSARDKTKLADFDGWIASIRPDQRPVVPHLEIANVGDVTALHTALLTALTAAGHDVACSPRCTLG